MTLKKKNNLKTLLLVILAVLTGSLSFAQYGNEWIKYDQKYFAFKIPTDGVYKIDFTTLSSAGVPVSSINSANFQVFGFEKEQAIWVEDGGDGSIDPGDYILLYAQKNTTWLDSLLYDNPEDVANKYYPHYNDTINYFLTWNTGLDNARYIPETDIDFPSYTAQNYFLRKVFKEGHFLYIEGEKISGMSRSNYTPAEGWFGNRVESSAPVNYREDLLSTTNVYSGPGAPSVSGTSVSAGVSNAIFEGEGNHHLRLQYGPTNITLVDTIFIGYQKNKFNFTLPPSALGASSTRIRHQLVNDLGVAADYQAVAFNELIYPHTSNLENTSYYRMSIPNNPSESKSRYDFTNFIAPSPIAFTLNGKMKKIPVVISGTTHQVLIPNLASGALQEFVILDESAIKNVAALKSVTPSGFFTNYAETDLEKAYIVVTGKELWSSATAYKNYRESSAGGAHNVVLTDVEELNYQFGGGVDKHVMGMRRFIHFAYNNTLTKPSHLFIIGKGIREGNEGAALGNGIRQNSFAYADCIVPSYGFPATDLLITARLEDNNWAPLISTGRIATKTNSEVLAYLDKMKEFELNQDPNSFYSKENKLWQKEILHFGGGSNEFEQNTFKFYLERYEDYLEGPNFGGNVTSYYKSVSDPVDPATLFEVTDIIDNGVSLMTFFGHASADGFDQNIDDPENWNNQGKYPVVVGNACLTGGIYEPGAFSASEEYILIENKGAIGFVSNVKQAFSNSLNTYSDQLFKEISRNDYGETLGEQTKRVIEEIQYDGMSFGLQNVCNQMILHGDPALRVNYHEKPELELNHTSLFFEPAVIDLTVDSIDVYVVTYNPG
jgi:hypothetical protein